MHSNTSQTAEIMRSTVHTVFEEEENNLPNCAALGWGGGGGRGSTHQPHGSQQEPTGRGFSNIILYSQQRKSHKLY